MRMIFTYLHLLALSMLLLTFTGCDPEFTCEDGIQNQDEEGVDCGGDNCDYPCHCKDNVQNEDEEGVDCGGDSCDPCPACDDGIQNGDEAGVDCGGSCIPCPACDDGILNGDEVGIDCGGSCEPCGENTFPDPRDGQVYNIVDIGSQTWFAENLNYGPPVGASACYNEEAAFCDTYGRLYDWATAMEACPEGWHLPDNAEWTELIDFLGDPFTAGGLMKATGTLQAGTGLWEDPNFGATNESGFAGLPGGVLNGSLGFGDIGLTGFWWSATKEADDIANYYYLSYNNSNATNNIFPVSVFFSVRCIKD